MPRKEERFAYGGFHLARRHNSPNWHRCRFDRESGQTRASSLGTGDFEEAKSRLIAYVHEHGKIDTDKAHELALWEILQRYEYQHARHLPTRAGKATLMHNIAVMREFAGDVPVAEFKLAKQEEIVRRMKARGWSDGYVKRIFTTTYAALRRAYRNEEIDRIPAKLPLPSGAARRYFATPLELARLWDALTEPHLKMFFILSLSTGARPGALLELSRFQCDFERGLINLDPPDRARNKKRRPTVPMTAFARAWIVGAEEGRLISYKGRAVTDVKAAWRRARLRVGLSAGLSPVALRHTVASWLRSQGVDKWRVEALGGWSDTTADAYAKYDPTYFGPVVSALERLFEEIEKEAKSSLQPPRTCESRARLVWKNGAGEANRTPDPNLGKVMLYP